MSRPIIIILIGFLTLSFNSKDNLNPSLIDNNLVKQQQREITVKAYVQMQNEWVEGYVFILNGVVTKVQFPDKQFGPSTITARYYQSTKPSALNPNNPIAVKNNFTHYVDIINYGRAYFSM